MKKTGIVRLEYRLADLVDVSAAPLLSDIERLIEVCHVPVPCTDFVLRHGKRILLQVPSFPPSSPCRDVLLKPVEYRLTT